MDGTKTSVRSGRFPSLDGLRGIAALVVFVFHALLISPQLCSIVDGAPTDDSYWWLTHTPLHLLWAGEEAVSLFFVLSGFVLGLPYLRAGARPPPWRAYYASRLVRLYLPVAGSLAFASMTYLLVDHHVDPEASRWIIGHDFALRPTIVLHDLVLVDGSSYLNSVLWSLRWEVIFSILLPLALLATTLAGRLRPLAALAALLLLAICGALDITSGAYMLMFGCGLLMAAERERLAAWSARMPFAGWVTMTVVALSLVLVRWWPGPKLVVAPALVTLASCMLLATCLWWPAASRACQLPPVKWLGERSFSFYLIHDPIVTCSALLLRTHNPVLILMVALPISLLVTSLFFRLVEVPSHAAAKRMGRLAARSSSATSSGTQPPALPRQT